jgi:uncharacterized protein YcbK (DUF882 family)
LSAAAQQLPLPKSGQPTIAAKDIVKLAEWLADFCEGQAQARVQAAATDLISGLRSASGVKKMSVHSRAIARHSSALRSSLIIRFVPRERLEETG